MKVRVTLKYAKEKSRANSIPFGYTLCLLIIIRVGLLNITFLAESVSHRCHLYSQFQWQHLESASFFRGAWSMRLNRILEKVIIGMLNYFLLTG